MPPHNRRESYRANHFKQSVFTRPGPISEVAARLIDVRSVGHSGLDLLTLSSSHFDPERSLMPLETPGLRPDRCTLFAASACHGPGKCRLGQIGSLAITTHRSATKC